MTTFTDSHCHLDFSELSTDLSALLAQCFQRNIKRIIIPSVSPENWSKVSSLVNTYQHKDQQVRLFYCLGIHPWFLDDLEMNHLELLAMEVEKNQNKIIAIGETGIDTVIAKQQNDTQKHLIKQQQFFDFQLNLAKQYQLPIVVHHRQSHQYIIPMLKQHKLTSAGVVHAFSGSYQQAKEYLDLGFKLGVGGTITYPRAKKTITALQKVPLSSLVLETDAPSIPIKGEQGKYNSPLALIAIFNQLTGIRDENSALIAQQLESNIDSLFFMP